MMKSKSNEAVRFLGFLSAVLTCAATCAAEGKQIWKIGSPDGKYAEFALAGTGGTDWEYPWDWTHKVVYTVGQSDAKLNWPFIHPGPDDHWAGTAQHSFTILFGLKRVADEGDGHLEVRLVDTHSVSPPRLRIAVNGKNFEESLPKGGGDETAFGHPEHGKPHRFDIKFPIDLLRAGNNQIVITTLSGSWMLYDSLALTAPEGTEPAEVDLSSMTVELAKPAVGTSGTGHTFPGACVPFGMVQLSPDTRTTGWEACAGYQGADSRILGFTHNHLSGTGCADLGNILMMPAVGPMKLSASKPGESGFPQAFSHESEKMSPGYYRVKFPAEKVTVELTATTRAGFHRYTFPASDEAHVCFDLHHGMATDVRESALNVESDRVISGYRKYNGWGGRMKFYFVAEFSKPFNKVSALVDNQGPVEGKQFQGRSIRAQADFSTANREQLLVKVGLSAVSVEGARKNLAAEIPEFDFDKTRAAAQHAWQQALAKIDAQSGDQKTLEIFYSALYHACLAPHIFCDVDGAFSGPDGKTHPSPGFSYCTTLSLWDTFRGENPLLYVLQPRHMEDVVKTMLTHYQLMPEHCLPVWVNAGRENWCMIAYHSISTIADAYRKGIRGFDADLALKAMLDTMNLNRSELDEYRNRGYIARNSPGRGSDRARLQKQAVSRTLELAYNDACLARFAAAIGKPEAGAASRKRAGNWRNLYDPATGFMRGKLYNGKWAEPFDPLKVDFDDFTEANAWHYLFFAPHDMPGLIATLGGERMFADRLDAMFNSPSGDLTAIPDLTGLIGQYCHGNEPCHHMAYLYACAGQPWKTQQRVRQVMAALYDNTRDGLPGNDDCGQISAWYVWSAMGLYPVDPASGKYILGSPVLDRATIHLDPKYATGKSFTIIARHNSPSNIYIESATLNGKPLLRNWISQEELTAGGELVLEMGPQPKFSRTVGGKGDEGEKDEG
jgi:predicted alpha-1,2-mannosidase